MIAFDRRWTIPSNIRDELRLREIRYASGGETLEEQTSNTGRHVVPVVGVGASAGGLEAFTQMLQALPVDTGMAFVLIQHLAPTRPSLLAEILSRATRMPVVEVHDEPRVQPNHVYVIPPIGTWSFPMEY
jgi:chemotaxis response regulator CheB